VKHHDLVVDVDGMETRQHADGYLKHLTWLADCVQTGPWDLTSAELGSWLDDRGWS
jgi:hypothetical protein